MQVEALIFHMIFLPWVSQYVQKILRADLYLNLFVT